MNKNIEKCYDKLIKKDIWSDDLNELNQKWRRWALNNHPDKIHYKNRAIKKRVLDNFQQVSSCVDDATNNFYKFKKISNLKHMVLPDFNDITQQTTKIEREYPDIYNLTGSLDNTYKLINTNKCTSPKICNSQITDNIKLLGVLYNLTQKITIDPLVSPDLYFVLQNLSNIILESAAFCIHLNSFVKRKKQYLQTGGSDVVKIPTTRSKLKTKDILNKMKSKNIPIPLSLSNIREADDIQYDKSRHDYLTNTFINAQLLNETDRSLLEQKLNILDKMATANIITAQSNLVNAKSDQLMVYLGALFDGLYISASLTISGLAAYFAHKFPQYGIKTLEDLQQYITLLNSYNIPNLPGIFSTISDILNGTKQTVTQATLSSLILTTELTELTAGPLALVVFLIFAFMMTIIYKLIGISQISFLGFTLKTSKRTKQIGGSTKYKNRPKFTAKRRSQHRNAPSLPDVDTDLDFDTDLNFETDIDQ